MDALHDSEFFNVFNAVVGAGVAAIGFIVALGQFSTGARARRVIEWTSQALEEENDAARVLLLRKLRLAGQSDLVARALVPPRLFTEATAWLIAVPVFLYVGTDGGSSTPLVLASVVITLTTVFRKAIRLYTERLRVARHFVEGRVSVEPVRVDILAQMEGGSRKEFALGFLCAFTFALSAWAISGSIASGPTNLSLYLSICAVVGLVFVLQSVNSYSRKFVDRTLRVARA